MKKKEKPPIPCLPEDFYLIDSHCHLDMESYRQDLESILQRAKEHGVHSIVTIGIDEQSSRAAVALAARYPMLQATVGIHPHDAESAGKNTYSNLQHLILNNRDHIVAYGEIGLDYAKHYSDESIQRTVFMKQLLLAKDMALPVIIHDRDAHEDTISILKQCGPFPAGGVMHCFSGDMHLATQVLQLGFYISIPGVVTFKNGKTLQDVAAKIPLDSMILETDGPFLSPAPYRGKRNEPAYIPYIAQKVAHLRGITIQEVAEQTSKNVEKLFDFRVPTP